MYIIHSYRCIIEFSIPKREIEVSRQRNWEFLESRNWKRKQKQQQISLALESPTLYGLRYRPTMHLLEVFFCSALEHVSVSCWISTSWLHFLLGIHYFVSVSTSFPRPRALRSNGWTDQWYVWMDEARKRLKREMDPSGIMGQRCTAPPHQTVDHK